MPNAAPIGIARKKPASTRPRIRRGKTSIRIVSAMTMNAAPPTPTSTLAAWSCSYVRASPVPTVARLPRANPTARSRDRRRRSATYPIGGAATVKPRSSIVESHPAWVSESRSSWLTPRRTAGNSHRCAELTRCIAKSSPKTAQAQSGTASAAFPSFGWLDASSRGSVLS